MAESRICSSEQCECYGLIQTMPFEADELIFGALLGPCKEHWNAELGRLAAERILSLRPEEGGREELD